MYQPHSIIFRRIIASSHHRTGLGIDRTERTPEEHVDGNLPPPPERHHAVGGEVSAQEPHRREPPVRGGVDPAECRRDRPAAPPAPLRPAGNRQDQRRPGTLPHPVGPGIPQEEGPGAQRLR